ncbi:MAG TPA: hypothetical protein VKW78_02465 [Terriglobales bacterium]|jgi:hypothetical protein|nr:hypothetical protein [Terriglobales bacterium]
MPKMIDLIRESAVPASVMRSAAHGALTLPSDEIVEILVYLSQHPIFGEQARLTLAGFKEDKLQPVAANSQTPSAVLDYLIASGNLRPALLPVLLENPSVPDKDIIELAKTGSRDVVVQLVGSSRARSIPRVCDELTRNPHLTPAEISSLASSSQVPELKPDQEAAAKEPDAPEVEAELARYQAENAAAIAAAEGKPFELAEASEEERGHLQSAPAAEPAKTVTPQAPAAKVAAEKPERLSTLQKIARLSVGERVQLAMKGSRDERFILIRDGSKVVSAAVLESPKLTDQEVETFAAMKNVQESVLRGIASKRKFMKLYAVTRSLTANPRCPLDVALPLMKNLLAPDLKSLSMNKNVSDTLRKLAFKMHREKTQSNKKSE